jgi:hypothetical protein
VGESWGLVKLAKNKGDDEAALADVKTKCFDELAKKRDLHFFVGTNFLNHMRGFPNPFMIVGLFYPPETDGSIQLQLDL